MGNWISFLSMNKTWKQYWISYEKYWCVISNYIPNSIFGVQFNSKSPWISKKINKILHGQLYYK